MSSQPSTTRPRAKSNDHHTSPSPAILADLERRIQAIAFSNPSPPKTAQASVTELPSTSTSTSTTPLTMSELIPKVVSYVKEYMAHYDGSHDYNHILRVLGLAHVLRQQEVEAYDKDIVTLATLLHDVGDRKYLKPGQDGLTMVRDVLVDLGAQEELASRIQAVVNCVSYSAETKPGGPEKIKMCIEKYGRELEVVQDADRLDAIGAVGVGRCFAFGGSKGRGLGVSIEHFSDKLEKLGGMMKTELGMKMARERTEVIVKMSKAWEDENKEAMKGLDGLHIE